MAISPSLELFIGPSPPPLPPPLIIDILSQFCKDEKPIFAVKPCRLSRKMVLPPIFIFICLKGLWHDLNSFLKDSKIKSVLLVCALLVFKSVDPEKPQLFQEPARGLEISTGSHLGHVLFQGFFGFFNASNEEWKLEKVDPIFFVFIFLFDQSP